MGLDHSVRLDPFFRFFIRQKVDVVFDVRCDDFLLNLHHVVVVQFHKVDHVLHVDQQLFRVLLHVLKIVKRFFSSVILFLTS